MEKKGRIRWRNKTVNHSTQLAVISPCWVCFILTHKQSRVQQRWRARTRMKDACRSGGCCWDLCSLSDRKPHLFCLGNFPQDPLWIHVVLLDLRLPPKQLHHLPWHSKRVAGCESAALCLWQSKGKLLWVFFFFVCFACMLNIWVWGGDLVLFPVAAKSQCGGRLKQDGTADSFLVRLVFVNPTSRLSLMTLFLHKEHGDLWLVGSH